MAKAKKTKKIAKKALTKKTIKKVAKVTKKPVRSAQKKSKPRPIIVSSPKKMRHGPVSQLISPLDDRILIRVDEAEKMTSGGLYIPDTASLTGHFRGEVVAIGRGHLDKKGRIRPIELKIGDRILFAQHTGSKVTLLDEELVILREQEVVGVLET